MENEKRAVKNAQQARALLKNSDNVDYILEHIYETAERDYNTCIFPEVNQVKKLKLIELGFAVSSHLDPIGMEMTKITW